MDMEIRHTETLELKIFLQQPKLLITVVEWVLECLMVLDQLQANILDNHTKIKIPQIMEDTTLHKCFHRLSRILSTTYQIISKVFQIASSSFTIIKDCMVEFHLHLAGVFSFKICQLKEAIFSYQMKFMEVSLEHILMMQLKKL